SAVGEAARFILETASGHFPAVADQERVALKLDFGIRNHVERAALKRDPARADLRTLLALDPHGPAPECFFVNGGLLARGLGVLFLKTLVVASYARLLRPTD